MSGRRHIVITTINHPTKAVKEFARRRDYEIIIVGDKKTPKEWKCDNCRFIPIEEQVGKHAISALLPENHYCRKMIGYLDAIEEKTKIIIDTDDDNSPMENFGFPQFEGEFQTVRGGMGFVNIYGYYSKMKIWPRGLPLDRINSPESMIEGACVSKEKIKVGIWQGLADGDPDVDAIYRLTDGRLCTFERNGEIALGKGTVSPFNSQNTAFSEEMFPLLYLPTTVTFRYTDILRGLVAQPIMWLKDRLLGITEATVYQDRNQHNYMKDFESEIPCYIGANKIIDTITPALDKDASVLDNLVAAYSALEKEGVVAKKEIELVGAWARDFERLKWKG